MFDEAKRTSFVEAISMMLKVQQVAATGYVIEDLSGNINRKAMGYIYGFIDGALQTIGQDMRDISIGVPITRQVLECLFPGKADSYMNFLASHIGTDAELIEGVMNGGKQYIDFNKPNAKGAPMGLARYLLKGIGQR
jgi:hypothetical protein